MERPIRNEKITSGSGIDKSYSDRVLFQGLVAKSLLKKIVCMFRFYRFSASSNLQNDDKIRMFVILPLHLVAL